MVVAHHFDCRFRLYFDSVVGRNSRMADAATLVNLVDGVSMAIAAMSMPTKFAKIAVSFAPCCHSLTTSRK